MMLCYISYMNAIFSSAYKVFTDNWCPCALVVLVWLHETSILVYMISLDETTGFKFINHTRGWVPIYMWGHMQGHVRQDE